MAPGPVAQVINGKLRPKIALTIVVVIFAIGIRYVACKTDYDEEFVSSLRNQRDQAIDELNDVKSKLHQCRDEAIIKDREKLQCEEKYSKEITKLEERKVDWLRLREKEFLSSVADIKEKLTDCEQRRDEYTNELKLDRNHCHDEKSNEKNWNYLFYGIFIAMFVCFCCSCLATLRHEVIERGGRLDISKFE